MKKVRNKWLQSFQAIKIIFDYEPRYFFYVIPEILLSGMLPLLLVYFPKLIIDAIINQPTYIDVIKVILIYGSLLFIMNGLKITLSNRSSLYANHFSKKLQMAIGKTTMAMDLSAIESSSHRDVVQLSNQVTSLTEAIRLLQMMVSQTLAVFGLVILITQLEFLFVIFVLMTLLLKIGVTLSKNKYNKKMRMAYANNDRQGNYLTNVAYSNRGGAKEIRVNQLQNWYMNKIKHYRNQMVGWQYKDFFRHFIFQCLTALAIGLQSYFVLRMLAHYYVTGMVTIADVTMYFSSVISLTTLLTTITDLIGQYNRQLLHLHDFNQLRSWIEKPKPNDAKETIPKQLNKNPTMEIEFRNISFRYPNTNNWVLEDVTLRMKANEKLVLVGPNGAGKTTFVKLLCKFYQPTKGTITLNGQNIWDIPNAEYYQLISAVFQDFANFSFTLKENITLNPLSTDDERLTAVEQAGLKHVIESLPKGLNSSLTRIFDPEGIELSGGQAQRLALARALYKDTPLIILDEPTANLDPKAENALYHHLFQVAQDKLTLFISHRLAASTFADHIAVFDGGKLVEYGSHDELIKNNGLYKEMYENQSQSYV